MTVPRPIDASVSVVFNTGGQSGTNSFSVYFREAVVDYITMLELNQYTMGELNGRPLPNQGDAKWEPRELSTLEGHDVGEFEGMTMRELERQEDMDLLSSFRITVEWGTTPGTSIYGLDSEGNGQSFLDVGDLVNNTIYVALLDVYDHTWRARIYPTSDNVINEAGLIFDTGEVNDDFHVKRRKGTLRLAESLVDGAADVIEMRTRHLNFAEYRSKPLKSHTPVEGAQVFAEYTPGVDHFESLTRQETELYRNLITDPSVEHGEPADVVFTGNGAVSTHANRASEWKQSGQYSYRGRATNMVATSFDYHYIYGLGNTFRGDAGKTYAVRCRLKIAQQAVGHSLSAGIICSNQAANAHPDWIRQTGLHILAPGEYDIVAIGVAPPTTYWLSPGVTCDGGASGTIDWYVDDWLVLEMPAGSTTGDVPPYFSGETPDAEWVGERHNSQSILFDVDVATKDKGKSLSGESYKITNVGITPQQSVRSNAITFENFNDYRVEFDIWYPQNALDNDNPVELYLRSLAGGALTKINLGHIRGDSWHHVKLYPVEGNVRLTGQYHLIWRQSATGQATEWWLDNIEVIEESMRWEARAVADDPWGDRKGVWTPFRDLVNSEHNGIVLHERGKELQVRGRALRQDVTLGTVKIKPKYAELGRVVFEERESHDDLTSAFAPTGPSGAITVDFGSSKKLDRAYLDFTEPPPNPNVSPILFQGSNDNVSYFRVIIDQNVANEGWNTYRFVEKPTWRYLRVTNPIGDPMTLQDMVVRPALLSPTAAFTSSVAGATVSFDASTSADTDGFIIGYVWDFGDGAQGFGKKVKHTYAETGLGYNVRLLVTDNHGNETIFTQEVGV